MASHGAAETMSPDTVLAAMATMRGGDANRKKAAMDYLSTFQKSVCRLSQPWFEILFFPGMRLLDE
jgi:hypothetical protein